MLRHVSEGVGRHTTSTGTAVAQAAALEESDALAPFWSLTCRYCCRKLVEAPVLEEGVTFQLEALEEHREGWVQVLWALPPDEDGERYPLGARCMRPLCRLRRWLAR